MRESQECNLERRPPEQLTAAQLGDTVQLGEEAAKLVEHVQLKLQTNDPD